MPGRTCPTCGYALDELDARCPRCIDRHHDETIAYLVANYRVTKARALDLMSDVGWDVAAAIAELTKGGGPPAASAHPLPSGPTAPGRIAGSRQTAAPSWQLLVLAGVAVLAVVLGLVAMIGGLGKQQSADRPAATRPAASSPTLSASRPSTQPAIIPPSPGQQRTQQREAARGQQQRYYQDPQGDVVYITPTGKRYHNAGCQHARNGTPMSRSQAQAAGYTPCQVCGG